MSATHAAKLPAPCALAMASPGSNSASSKEDDEATITLEDTSFMRSVRKQEEELRALQDARRSTAREDDSVSVATESSVSATLTDTATKDYNLPRPPLRRTTGASVKSASDGTCPCALAARSFVTHYCTALEQVSAAPTHIRTARLAPVRVKLPCSSETVHNSPCTAGMNAELEEDISIPWESIKLSGVIGRGIYCGGDN